MEQRCKYAYKACFEPRTRKRNGSLHNFCVYHRQKANIIQKKHISKRIRTNALPEPVPFAAADAADSASYDAWPTLLSLLLDGPIRLDPIAFDAGGPTAIDAELVALLVDLVP
ncbi:hypothetical protein SPRG_05122 [Saprolegnia parasitica CBS 223.65]|uniref:Uncharacterized protein n=1 Tax=Saprolegnia parasitica (strain CBS 223.65) TaxID=695850 RepID=A0A067CT09_SAPPC|nr:hypothetical protein SPRG_05122 [Saprolegnia parasitica CBS 223.65]KDO29932.1 hypothetical protein SPRG_05122 [Saprolegnia parasitica CBS 223.65]|eukprot:XP_012199116.1 hypothetical protein SPRG_05122 [Saprolegnia parasitica CBS 223.65]